MSSELTLIQPWQSIQLPHLMCANWLTLDTILDVLKHGK